MANPLQSKKHGVIGVFDSGVGGLTVVRKLREMLPNETIVYLGDTARVPYGSKSRSTIQRYSQEALFFLEAVARELPERLGHIQSQSQPAWGGLKLVVIACNTATAASLHLLRELVNIPILGVIRPAAKAALRGTRRRAIGVIGTESTIRSNAYQTTLEELDPGIEVFARPCPMLAPLVEEAWIDHPVTRLALQTYLNDFFQWKTDTLILGCTHYPLLRTLIQELLGEGVFLVDSAETTAYEVDAALRQRGWSAPQDSRGELLCFVTDVPDRFRRLASHFLGSAPQTIEQVTLARFIGDLKER